MITVQPGGGLCNRMRTMNSAYFLAKRLGKELRVLWRTDITLNCPFEKLFELPKEVQIINYRYSFSPVPKKAKKNANIYLSLADISEYTNKGTRMLPDSVIEGLKGNIYIDTCQQFLEHPDYHLFKPIPSIQKRIDEILKDYGEHCVGVHIRRTDSVKSIATSTTEDFIQKMKEEMELIPDTKFYLATDDEKEEETIRGVFGHKILSLKNKTLDRNSEQGIQDALVDFMCLANTKKIIGSYWSSFTDIAADFYKIPKYIVGEEN